MGATEKLGLQLTAADTKRIQLLLGVLFALLAAWFGWSGLRQWQDAALADNVEAARNKAVAETQQAITTATGRLDALLQVPAIQEALISGERAGVIQAIKDEWKEAESVDLLPADLQAAYGDPGAFGFSKLALLEAAQQSEKSVARAIREESQTRFGVAAGVPQGVVYVSLPLSHLAAGIDQAGVSDSGYLALRQGTYNVHQRGDASLADGAEVLAHAVGETGLRVAAAVPDSTTGAFGLGVVGSLILAVLAGLSSAALLLLSRGKLGSLPTRIRRESKGTQDEEVAQTLGEAMELEPRATVVAPKPVQGSGATLTTEPTTIDPGIFRAYDIRGIVGQGLNPDVAERIGQAVGTVMREQDLVDIVVGRDGRHSGPDLVRGLIQGLRRAGCNVIDIGLAPTPVTYFAAYHLRAGSCISVTGSHNPPDYNGFKIVVGGETLSGDAIIDLHARIDQGLLRTDETLGDVQQRDIAADYIQRIADDVQLERPLKVVVDAGNGVAGDIAPGLLEAIGAEVIPLYCDVDGSFPNHHPDPSELHNLEDLIQMVKQFDADLGLAFDGDGDRLGVVTREGAVVFPDRLLMLFAADVLERNPGAMVIYDVKCTGKLQGWVLRHGGTPMMWKTGHSLIKARMREVGAELAGEMSGHFFFQERWYGFDDGLYSAARLLEILALRAETPSEVLNGLPDSISTPEIKVTVDKPTSAGSTPHEIVGRFMDVARFDGAQLSTIDGLRADWPDGWGLMRASNTTPVLVLRFEADHPQALDRIRNEFRMQLAAIAPELDLTF